MKNLNNTRCDLLCKAANSETILCPYIWTRATQEDWSPCSSIQGLIWLDCTFDNDPGQNTGTKKWCQVYGVIIGMWLLMLNFWLVFNWTTREFSHMDFMPVVVYICTRSQIALLLLSFEVWTLHGTNAFNCSEGLSSWLELGSIGFPGAAVKHQSVGAFMNPISHLRNSSVFSKIGPNKIFNCANMR